MDSAAWFSLKLSIQVAFLATTMIVIVGVALAYLLAMKSFRGKEMLDMFLTLPLVLPPTVTGFFLVLIFGRNGYLGRPLYELTGWSIMFTWQAAVLASFVVALPLMIKTARAAVESVDRNLINASYTLGHSKFETALRVILPLAKRGIIAGAVLSFARAMGEFGATLMLAGNIPGRTDTMPIAIYSMASSGEWARSGTMVAFFTAVSGAFLYIANLYNRRAV
ncbi:MAG: molybdate ABC transporter permease subunit [Nitrospirae bacterium]|nr:molybdate ABC transporter permease subunit [Nitrospirota bacterium]